MLYIDICLSSYIVGRNIVPEPQDLLTLGELLQLSRRLLGVFPVVKVWPEKET